MSGKYQLTDHERGEYTFIPQLEKNEYLIDIQSDYGSRIEQGSSTIRGMDIGLHFPTQPPKYLYCNISSKDPGEINNIAHLKTNMTTFHLHTRFTIPIIKNQDSDFIFTSDKNYDFHQQPLDCFSINILKHHDKKYNLISTKYTQTIFNEYNEKITKATGQSLSELYNAYVPLYGAFAIGAKDHYTTPKVLDAYHYFIDFLKLSSIYQQYIKDIESTDHSKLDFDQLPFMLVGKAFLTTEGHDEL